ncbi:hypothetical protein T440DRAFT_510024 [Plenodomus tracheiphilus IPT5]|uniref:Fungal N-terminal domain-containing protein n=1 Tax=Plenodomus tracheiphilus IPT5 TaxID=1408161 RepID=A0A6A7AWV1_9PLEO|nr:hypothetical protein T440DRAFT_510024 [Plenodomus tracheiphilus IPT5]
MDPLSITASIVGILAAAAKIGEMLHGVISTAKDAPQVLKSLACEVREIRAACLALHTLIDEISSAPVRRAALIQIEDLAITFTGTVLTLSELEEALAPFSISHGRRTPLKLRLRWNQAEGSCMKIVDRLQRHKVSISLMLNILQCASDYDADRSQNALMATISILLDSNRDLCSRFRNLEQSVIARKTNATIATDTSCSLHNKDDTIISIPISQPDTNVTDPAISRPPYFTFEDDLQASRVYRAARKNGSSGPSSITSAIRTQTWSAFSGLCLADISVISVIALPLYAGDIPNQSQHYIFGSGSPVAALSGADAQMRPTQQLKDTGFWTQDLDSMLHHGVLTPDANPCGRRFPVIRSQQIQAHPKYALSAASLHSSKYVKHKHLEHTCNTCQTAPYHAVGLGIMFNRDFNRKHQVLYSFGFNGSSLVQGTSVFDECVPMVQYGESGARRRLGVPLVAVEEEEEQ